MFAQAIGALYRRMWRRVRPQFWIKSESGEGAGEKFSFRKNWRSRLGDELSKGPTTFLHAFRRRYPRLGAQQAHAAPAYVRRLRQGFQRSPKDPIARRFPCRKSAPPDLALQLKVAISKQR